MSAASLAYFVSIGMTLPVLPLFVEGPLGGSEIEVGIVAGAFSVASVLLRPVAGRVGDIRGRRLLMMTGGAIAATSVGAVALVDSLPLVVLLRLVNGIGEAFFFTGAASAVSDLSPPERRGEAMSLFSVTLYGGLASGPLIGEWLSRSSGFDAVWVGAFGIGILGALLGCALPALVPAERPVKMRLIHPAGLAPGLVLMCSAWAFAGFLSFLPLYAKTLGMDGTGILFFLYSFFILMVRLFGAKIPDTFGFGRTIAVSLAMTAAGMVLMATLGTVTGLYVSAVVLGIGQSLAAPALMALAVKGVPASETGSVIGTFTAFLDVGFGIGPFALGFVAERSGYRPMWLTSAVVVGVGMVILRGRKNRN